MPPKALVVVFGTTLFVCWLWAAYNWIRSLGHLKPGISVSTMLLNGIKAFDADNFTEEGRPYVRSFVRGAMGSFLCVLAAFAVAAVTLVKQG